ncbi:MAG: YfcE family phosphodiesterase [Oscillospiraceae bacterium]|nr:YfcE family phosphodiesterase [Oscillospiraceae bacterium]
MRILIVSDSHGDEAFLEMILRRERSCDMIIHLGDGADDLMRFLEYTAHKPVYLTKGNCDPAAYGYAEKHIIPAEGKKLLSCHGHRFNVKMGLDALYFEGLKENADVCLYGHTHAGNIELSNGLLLFNPGAVKNGRYGILTVKNGEISPELKSI